MASKPLIKESLFSLNLCGIDPHNTNVSSNVRAVLSVTLLSTILFNMILELIFHWKGLKSMQLLTLVVAVYQINFRLIMTLIYRRDFVKVITKFDQFWPVNKCSQELQNEIQSTHESVRKVAKLMTVILMLILTTFLIIPVSERQLPAPGYYPEDLTKTPDYELAIVLQALTMVFAAIVLFSTDCLFMSLIISIISELKMLREGFSKVPIVQAKNQTEEETLRYLYEMVDHHALISGCIKKVKEIYSIFLLNVYFYSMTVMGISLLSIISTGFPPSFQSFTEFGLLVVFYSLQLFFYCATGTYLINESENLSIVVYDTSWWVKAQPELRKAYVLIIMRANKAEALTAGGMFTLNLDSFRKVIRSTLSLFTLVEAIYKPQNFEKRFD